MTALFDLVVIGSGPTALSIAAHGRRRGVDRVLVLAGDETPSPADAVVRYSLDVRHGFLVETVEPRPDGTVLVESTTESLLSAIVVKVESTAGGDPPFAVATSVSKRVHRGVAGFDPADADVLVVGQGDDVVESADRLLAGGARVVVAFAGDPAALSRIGREALAAMEDERRVTVLWHSIPDAVEDLSGLPMAFFSDRRTPDLQFDHVVVCFPAGPTNSGRDGRIMVVDPMVDAHDPYGPANAWATIAEAYSDELPPSRPGWPGATSTMEIERLRAERYNATITYFDFSHDDLWVIRVRPDHRDSTHRPGQYATLGLGYWEPRVDDADEKLGDVRRAQLIRRSYSISSRIFDEHGYLADPAEEDEIELYIVHVRPSEGRIPALTPRLAGKRVGDRIYIGPKIAGRYTLDPVVDPDTDVVFLATGTGEAPHNSMLVTLLRKGHRGRILSVVSVRRLRDLGYVEQHRRIERHWHNYRYVPIPTREPDSPKRYIQDLFTSGEIDGLVDLDPSNAHVFLCGNPSMIGLPSWAGATPRFPDTVGVAELLQDRGFRLDRRGHVGNVHYEEYW